MFTWDAGVGHNNDASPGLAVVSLGVVATAAVWEPILFAKRRRIRRQLIEQANTVSAP